MLNIDSPRWTELEHAYGDAAMTPTQLYQLLEKQYYDEDPHDLLFGCLCHQGSVYTATYAAVPHFVNALSTQSTDSKVWLFTFLGQVAISKDAEPMPDDLRAAYFAAMTKAKSLVINVAKQMAIPKVDYAHLLSSVPALHGLDMVHEIVDCMLTADEVCGLCQACGEEFSVDSEAIPFKARHVQQHPTMAPIRGVPYPDNIGVAGTPRGSQIEVCPAPVPPSLWDGSIREENAMSWLVSLATSANHPLVVEMVLSLFGRLDCPNCKTKIALWEAARRKREA